VVDQALGGLGSPHPLIDDEGDLQDPVAAVEEGFHPVSNPYLGGGLGN
jgi:hypothetical protein